MIRSSALRGLLAVTAAVAIAAAPSAVFQHAALAAAETEPGAAGADAVVSGVGEADGYHLYLARSSGRWQWRPLAVLAPGGADGEQWTGQQCVTGDGRTAVAVVAPWHAVNAPAGRDRAGTAIAVDLATGRARVLASGVSLYYFDPGCGLGSDVTMTRYLGSSQEVTQVVEVSAATGRVTQTQTVTGEVTSAVPAGGSIVAAEGDRLVRLSGNSVRPLASLASGAFDLRPDAVGGVDLLTEVLAARARAITAWRWAGGRLTRLSPSATGQVSLLAAGSGRTVLTGSRVLGAAPRGLTAVAAPAREVDGVSRDGSVELIAPARAQGARPLLPELLTASGRLIRAAVAVPAASPAGKARPAAAATPLVTGDTPVDRRAAIGGADSVPARDAGLQRAAAAQVAGTATPRCAVPRDDLNIQVPQPSNEQVNWAVEEAVINDLPSRPAEFDNMPTASYSPEADFPQPPLLGANTSGTHVPEKLEDAILAQESNWDQASWHAAPGLAGDPLVADYYGNGGDASQPIDYAAADCGYGLGQITPIMFSGAYNASVQERVAVDYAENIAASVQILAQTWNQLYRDNITVNGADPNWLENWYDAVWAYNSGIEPNAANGNTSGCQPGPACHDTAGNWGLGWANNPINPVYPPNRPVFLSDSYSDASHPSEWPYEELIFGWMATPLQRSENGNSGDAYAGADGANSGYLAQPPPQTFCSTATGYDNCDPGDPNGQHCLYQSGTLAYHCWWHQPVTFADGCAAVLWCTTAQMGETSGQTEPTATNPVPPTCSRDRSALTASGEGPVGITIVTDEGLPAWDPENSDVNLAGCPSTPSNWSQGGTFSMTNVWDSSDNPLPGQVDFHQLGAGFGGHMWFTHIVASGDTAGKVTGTWTPNLSSSNPNGGTGSYGVYAFVPDIGATANAVYTVNTNYGGRRSFSVAVNQDKTSGWVPLGFYYLNPGASVSLSNTAASASADDLAFNAVAFVRFTQAGTPSWVAMGDSYSSGEGAPPFDDGTDQPGVNMCHRSLLTYSEKAWLYSNYNGSVVNTACSGATSNDLQNTGQFTEAPQWAVLGDSTSLVTLTIGGDDLGFAPIMNDCVTKAVLNQDCEEDWPNLDDDIAAEETTLVDNYQLIQAQAPNAKIVVLTYPNIFPTSDPGPCATLTNLTEDDVNWLSGEAQKLDSTIKDAVNLASSQFAVPVSYLDEQNAFAGHDVCTTSPWVNQVNDISLFESGNPSVLQTFFHPNQDGYDREAGDLAGYLVRNGLTGH